MSRAALIPFRRLAIAVSLAALCGAGRAGATPRTNLPPMPGGCDPAAVRARLADVDSAQVSRACGNINAPWAYRGPSGRHMAMQVYGRRAGEREWARGFAAQLLAASPVDSAFKVPSTRVACDSGDASPIYFVMLSGRKWQTFILLRFDVGAALLFDAEQPLGMIRMAGRADSLWAALANRLDDDPLLRGPRPAPSPERRPATDFGQFVFVEELPEVVARVAPRYPERARQGGIEGTVFVQALVGADGTVRDALIASGPSDLRDEALAAIWQWRFKPARTNHDAVPVWVAVPMKFSLR